MELVERSKFLELLQTKFKNIAAGEGHCVLINGEAGVGKTSLVRAFYNEIKNECKIYQGTCDALFTPRPLAPVYDILWQIQADIGQNNIDLPERNELFTRLFRELENRSETELIVIEDIHWADEATLDFIKFL